MSFTMKALAAAALGLHWSGLMIMLYEVMLWLCYGYVMSTAMAAASTRREVEKTAAWEALYAGAQQGSHRLPTAVGNHQLIASTGAAKSD